MMLSICPVVHFNPEGEIVALESVRTPRKALSRTCDILKEKIGDRSPEDYLLWHVYTGPSLLETLKELEEKHGVKTNHEDVIMSPVSGCHNGPWPATGWYSFAGRTSRWTSNAPGRAYQPDSIGIDSSGSWLWSNRLYPVHRTRFSPL